MIINAIRCYQCCRSLPSYTLLHVEQGIGRWYAIEGTPFLLAAPWWMSMMDGWMDDDSWEHISSWPFHCPISLSSSKSAKRTANENPAAARTFHRKSMVLYPGQSLSRTVPSQCPHADHDRQEEIFCTTWTSLSTFVFSVWDPLQWANRERRLKPRPETGPPNETMPQCSKNPWPAKRVEHDWTTERYFRISANSQGLWWWAFPMA